MNPRVLKFSSALVFAFRRAEIPVVLVGDQSEHRVRIGNVVVQIAGLGSRLSHQREKIGRRSAVPFASSVAIGKHCPGYAISGIETNRRLLVFNGFLVALLGVLAKRQLAFGKSELS